MDWTGKSKSHWFALSLTGLFLLLGSTLHAQELKDEWLKDLEPRSIGPAGMSGRVTAIDVDPVNDQKIWIGTASGGVWVSDNGGTKWKPVFDKEKVQAIGAVAINPSNPSDIWVGTGEGNPRNSHNSGEGIFRSIDGGRSWKCLGLEETRLIHRIAIHRDDPKTVWAGALGSAWGPHVQRGLFRTRDGGKTWDKVLYVNDRTGVADMVVDHLHPEKMLVAMWEFGRTPWDFYSGGKGSGLYLTYDGGDTWERLDEKSGLPKGDLGRIGLAIARNKPNIVYALVEAKENALYRSEDGGHNWKKVATKNIGNRPFYYAEIYVDPKNENRLYNLYSLVSRSEDGGKTFDVLLPYSGVHPDHHAFWISPDNPDYLIDGNDGGLNISRDGGKTWQFMSNLPLGQFYHVNVDMEFPYNIYGGMQDNGSWVGPSSVLRRGGIRNYDWQELYFGDGFDVVPSAANSRYGWAMSQGGNVAYYDRLTGATEFVKPVHPDGEKLRFNWNAAISLDPFHEKGVYYGSQYVHYSTDNGRSWAILSPDLTTNDPDKQKQAESGGLTTDATSAENHTTILCIAPSPHEEGTIWVGTDDGRLQLTRDSGESWTDVSGRLPGYPAGSWIPQIEVSPHDEGTAFVVVNNYRRNDWAPYLYVTSDYGVSWNRLVGEGDVEGHVMSVVQDLQVEDLLFVGTDYGLYYSLDGGGKWAKWTAGLPSVSMRDMKVHPREGDLVLGTFGRAFYVLDDIGFLRAMAATGGSVLDTALRLMPIPDAYEVEYASYQGIRFTADGEFIGDNKRYGAAMLTVWVKPESEKEKEKEQMKEEKKQGKQTKEKEEKKTTEKDTKAEESGDEEAEDKKDDKKDAKWVVRDTQGDTIRHFSRPLEAGFNRLYWGLEQDGVRGPSRRRAKEDADPPGGIGVLPGRYELVVSYKGHRDSAWVTVHDDPRLLRPREELEARRTVQQLYERDMDRAHQAFDRLLVVEEQLGRVKNIQSHWPDSIKKEVGRRSKSIKKELDSLQGIFMLSDDKKDGYYDSSHTLNSKIYSARSYINSAWGEPGANAGYALQHVREEINKTVAAVNRFIEGSWSEYVGWIEGLSLSPFEPVKPVPE
jgi:photosystem II stability/assembly factor-like uncharacterized protein